MGSERKKFNTQVFEKILDFIEHFYPDIYEGSKERYKEEQGDRFEILKDENNFMEDYNAWFLVKMILPSNVTVVQMAESFPGDYFDKEEKKALKNLLNYIESCFEILFISEDKKIYKIRDEVDESIYEIKTFNLAPKFKEGDIIQSLIVKDVEDNYFFFGGIQSFEIKDRDIFLLLLKTKLKLEDVERRKRERQGVEWDVEGEEERDFPKNEDEVWDNKTKVNGVWIDDESGEVL